MNRILKEDIESFELCDSLAELLKDTTIIVTGATGLIGSTLVRCIHALKLGVRFILPVRNVEKGYQLFENEKDAVTIVQSDLKEYFEKCTVGCDYIIHCASPTNGQYMSDHPVETFVLAVESTKAILDYALRHKVKSMVYVSSIEYYGRIFDSNPVTEDMCGSVDHKSPRSSYALGKQAAEYIAFSYAREFGVHVKSARLTQTFGAGISEADKRVFAQFARSVIDGSNIVLHTEGRSAKPYCYTTDAVAALIYILLKGKDGEAYNVATPGTYITIRELAELFRNCINPDVAVEVVLNENSGYAPDTTVNLNSDRLLQLGWKPKYGMEEMIRRLVDYLMNN